MADQQNNNSSIMDEGESSSSTSSCNCATCPQDITILFEGGEFRRYLEYHVTNYKTLRPNVNIRLEEVSPSSSSTSSSAFATEISKAESLISQVLNLNGEDGTSSSSSSTTTGTAATVPSTSWDGIIFPAHWTGALVESNRLWDLTDYVEEQLNLPPRSVQEQPSTTDVQFQLDWPNIQPFIRSQQATFDGRVRFLPLDGDVLSLYYRRDLFEKYQIQVPRTWEEYTEAATFFHGKPWGPYGSPLNGSCISRANNCANYYWTSLILSSMTQSMGSSVGYLLDPSTLDPLLGEAMAATLKVLADQTRVGPDDELLTMMDDVVTACMQVNFDLNDGTCAMTYNWGNQILFSGRSNRTDGLLPSIGVAPTPGSTRVMNRDTFLLEDCTPELCPFGTFYDDIGIVNRPSYSAFGGWQGGVSNTSPTGRQYAMADFFAYMSNQAQSLPSDVLPNERSSFADPYRYSHLASSSWINASIDNVTALQYTDSIAGINSQNTVIDFRIRPGMDIRNIIDEEVYSYLMSTKARSSTGNSTNDDDALLRYQVTDRMDGRIQQVISLSNRNTVSRMYQASLGLTNATTGDSSSSSTNGIDPKYRSAGWGVGGLICCTSLALVLWTLWYRRNRVMQAFQPYLLIQYATGLFFMGGTIILLGLDDTVVNDDDILDISCMATPWIYVIGFSIFFSSVYSKIRVCTRIFHAPEKHDALLVRPIDTFKESARLLILNSVILFLWTFVDPLEWVRLEVTDGMTYSDGTVETYGACRGETTSSMLGFVLGLFFLNLILCAVGIFHAFKCRFLVLEYNEMQWLPLSLFPFFEAWIVGCPILFFVRDDPTTTFLVLTIVISTSSIAATLAVFAPKDWYIRKYRGMGGKGSKIQSRTTKAGVLVLKHPTVESRKQLVKLQTQLERVTSYNTELMIDIRVLKEKFRQLAKREKLAVAHSLFGEEISAEDTTNSRGNFIVRGGDDFEQTENTPAQEDELEAMEHFASVWSSMPDDDDVEEDAISEADKTEMSIPAPDTSLEYDLEIAAANAIGRDAGYDGGEGISGGATAGLAAGIGILGVAFASTSRSQRDGKDAEQTGIDRSDNSGGFAAVEAIPARVRETPRESHTIKESRSIGSSTNESMVGPESNPFSLHYPEPSHPSNSDGESSAESFSRDDSYLPKVFSAPLIVASSFDEDKNDADDELRRLGKEIELDDLEALEAEARALAEQFKLTKTFLESISDIHTNYDEGRETQHELHDLDISKITDNTLESAPNESQFRPSIKSNQGILNDRSVVTAMTDDMNDTSSSTGVDISGSAGESSGGAYVSRCATLELMDDYSSQHAGEPSEDLSFSHGPRKDNDGEGCCDVDIVGAGNNVQDDYHGMKPLLAPQHHRNNKSNTSILSDQARSPFRSSSLLSSGLDSPANRSNNNISVMIADWSAVGATGALLADLSDSQSTSSHSESYADSFSSMEQPTARISHRTSHLDVPLAKEIDQLVAQADFDAVVVAAQKFEVSPIQHAADDDEEVRSKKIAETKRKKRELEAWNISLSRSFEKDR